MKREILSAEGTYPAALLQEEESDRAVIEEIRQGSVVGYPSFDFTDQDLVFLELAGKYYGTILVAADPERREILGEMDVEVRNPDWQNYLIPIAVRPGKSGLYFHFMGEGELKFKTLGFFSM